MFDILKNFLQGASVQVQDPFFASMMRWFGRLQEAAFVRWRQVAASGIRCSGQAHVARVGLIACPHPAIGACLLCGSPTCIEHSIIASNGNIACIKCMNEVIKAKKGTQASWADEPPPQPQPNQASSSAEDPATTRLKHLRRLGLKYGTSFEETKEKFRTLSRTMHPDRVKDPSKKAAAEKKYKLITESFHWLESHRE